MKKPLSAITLARLLKRYKVRPRDIRIGKNHRKGYLLGSLTDAFQRYLPAEPRHPRQASNDGALQLPPSRDTAPVVAGTAKPESAEESGVVTGVTGQQVPLPGSEEPAAALAGPGETQRWWEA